MADDQRTATLGGFLYPVKECRTCHAPMVWAVSTASGKPLPLDLEPAPNGRLIIAGTRDSSRGPSPSVRWEGKPGEETDTTSPRYTTHFATCPNATEHRRPRGAQR